MPECLSSNVAISLAPERERCGPGAYVVSEPQSCDTHRMSALLLRQKTLPYIMDLETGISFPRDRASLSRDPDSASRDMIRRRAHSPSEAEGHPDNRGSASWLDAETQLEPTSRLRVIAIPAVRLNPLPHERRPTAPFDVTASAPAARNVAHDGPSPLCREASGDDVRDYAFHLYVQSGCDEAHKAECWTEARLSLDARIPTMALGTGTRLGKPNSTSKKSEE